MIRKIKGNFQRGRLVSFPENTYARSISTCDVLHFALYKYRKPKCSVENVEIICLVFTVCSF